MVIHAAFLRAPSIDKLATNSSVQFVQDYYALTSYVYMYVYVRYARIDLNTSLDRPFKWLYKMVVNLTQVMSTRSYLSNSSCRGNHPSCNT